METRTKEFVWTAKLSKKDKVSKWAGDKEGVLEQIILKLAVLGQGAVKGERNLVQVTTFDSEQNKISACVCALTLGLKEDQQLADLSLFPPANFTLIEGSGPVHIIGNHVVLDEDDDLSDEDDIMSESEEDEIDDSIEDLKTKGLKNKKKKSAIVKAVASDDDDDFEDMEADGEEEDDEKVLEQVVSKKRKLENGKQEPQKKKQPAVEKMTSPERASKNVTEQKTPKSQKDVPKTPKSEKKTPSKAKPPASVEEVKAAIKKYPGGKPRKEDKFLNWITGQFKVTDDAWKGELWKWHKKESGL